MIDVWFGRRLLSAFRHLQFPLVIVIELEAAEVAFFITQFPAAMKIVREQEYGFGLEEQDITGLEPLDLGGAELHIAGGHGESPREAGRIRRGPGPGMAVACGGEEFRRKKNAESPGEIRKADREL